MIIIFIQILDRGLWVKFSQVFVQQIFPLVTIVQGVLVCGQITVVIDLRLVILYIYQSLSVISI